MTATLSPNAIAYVRVSTEEQAESRLGLDAQQSTIAKAAARLGLQLRTVYIDAGRSGALPLKERPVLAEAIASLRRDDVLLIAKRDRLGRDLFETTLAERLVQKRGARVVSAAGEGTADDRDETPSNWMQRTIVDVFAQYERLLIVARTKDALAAKRARGERAGQIPLGFMLDPADPTRLAPAPTEQRLVARARSLRAAGSSYRSIATALREEGWRTRRGTPLRFQFVARMLKSA